MYDTYQNLGYLSAMECSLDAWGPPFGMWDAWLFHECDERNHERELRWRACMAAGTCKKIRTAPTLSAARTYKR